MNTEDQRDAIDRLYERLAPVEPPVDFVARVMTRASQGEVAHWAGWQRVLFGCGYVAALVVLAVLAFLTGLAFERSGLRDLLALAIHDFSAVSESPSVYVAAVRDAVPWLHLLAIVGDLALLALATRLVLKVSAPESSGATAPSG
ncbi:MAG TPA: hypothetical protein VFD32_21025 [Dehalococcoidia bacterium]|nr:hypothetical protein [Dehalococcoidia bacterium]